MQLPDGSPLLEFDALKVDARKVAEDQLLFVLGEQPGRVLMSEALVKAVLAVKSEDEWAIQLDKVS